MGFKNKCKECKYFNLIKEPGELRCNLSFSKTCYDFSSFEPREEDKVNHPSHYTAGGIETIDFIKAKTKHLPGDQGYLAGNVIKYITRYSLKNGKEDLLKAEKYLKMLLEVVE